MSFYHQMLSALKLLYNPDYAVCNNISSLYVAREHLENAIILDGDQIVFNPEILSPSFERNPFSVFPQFINHVIFDFQMQFVSHHIRNIFQIQMLPCVTVP